METRVGGDDMGTEEEGNGREAARCVSEAFRCQGANLLPGFLEPAQFSMWERKKQLCGTGDIICDTLGVTNSDIFSNKIR